MKANPTSQASAKARRTVRKTQAPKLQPQGAPADAVCDFCRTYEATIHISQVVENRLRETDLCVQCAKALGFDGLKKGPCREPSPPTAVPVDYLTEDGRAALLKLVAHDSHEGLCELEAAVDGALSLLDLYGRAYENMVGTVCDNPMSEDIKAGSASRRWDVLRALAGEFRKSAERAGQVSYQLLALRALVGLPLSQTQSAKLTSMLKELVWLSRPVREAAPAAGGSGVAA